MRHITLIIAVLALAVAAPAIAGKGGSGNGNGNGGGGNGGSGGGNNVTATGSCTVSGTVVSATGLPNGVLLNLMVSDQAGGWNQVLGYTDDGTWSVTVPAPKGSTTYEFASKTWGPSGSPHYDVYARCSS
jgi:hypothetical protein